MITASMFIMSITTILFIISSTNTTPSLPHWIGLLIQPISDLSVELMKNFTLMLPIRSLMLVDYQALKTSNGQPKPQRSVGTLKVSILLVKMVLTSMVLMSPETIDLSPLLMISAF